MHRGDMAGSKAAGAMEGVHITESLSRILENSQHSGLAMLQRAAAAIVVQQQQQTGEGDNTVTGNKETAAVTSKKDMTRDVGGGSTSCDGSDSSRGSVIGVNAQTTVPSSATVLPSSQQRPISLVSTSAAATGSGTNQRLSLPIIHGQNGQLLMLMNQSDLVRLAQESALSQMLSITASARAVNAAVSESMNDSANAAPLSPEGDSSGVLMSEGSSDRALRRKSVHNEVEKRRRQKINMWIEKLSSIIPPSPSMDRQQQQQQIVGESSQNASNLSCKADVLQRTYDYVIQISKAHAELSQMLTVLQQENEVLRGEIGRLGNLVDRNRVQVITQRLQGQESVERTGSPSVALSSNSRGSSPSANVVAAATVATMANTTSSSSSSAVAANAPSPSPSPPPPPPNSGSARISGAQPSTTVALLVPASIMSGGQHSLKSVPSQQPIVVTSAVKRSSLPVASIVSVRNRSSSPNDPTSNNNGSRQIVSSMQPSSTITTINLHRSSQQPSLLQQATVVAQQLQQQQQQQEQSASQNLARKRRGGPIDS